MSLNSYFLEQNCYQVLQTCKFNGAAGGSCASEFCFGFPSTSGTCPQIGLDPQNCCGSSDPATCLYNWVHGGSGAAKDNPCASVVGILLDCSSRNPTLFPAAAAATTIFPPGAIPTTGADATALASCMCYSTDGSYDPGVLDGFADSCVQSGSAAHPTYFPYASEVLGYCTINAGPAGAAATTTAPVASSSDGATSTPAAVATTTSQPAATTTSGAAGASSPATGASNPPASTATTKSSGAVKNTLQVAAVILLSFNMLLGLY